MNNVRGVLVRAPVQKSSVGGFQAAGGDDQSLGTRGQLRVGRVFQCAPKIGDPILDRLASYFVVDVDMPMDLGDGNELETDCGGGRCRFSAIRFRGGAHGKCIWHVKCHDQVSDGSLRWSFSVHFVSRLMGQV